MNRNNNHESVPQMYEKNVRNTKNSNVYFSLKWRENLFFCEIFRILQ